MSLSRRIAALAINLLLLAVALTTFRHPHADAYGPASAFVFGRGNAPADVRRAVVAQLAAFQEGYRQRQATAVEAFSAKLLSDDVTALGTSPREIYTGRKAVNDLVRSDWASWGDCTFFPATAHVSSHGDTAWFAMVGYVKFDLSRFLVLPLRVSGTLVRAGTAWTFSQLQFQFDLDLSWLLLLDAILLGWLAVNLALLAWALVVRTRHVRR